ncbi:glyoxalase superfamily protein [Paenibacillus kobensis]|uniref:glyoxalase superfamily protein n=1 Tax=Paenibacillus kobensis TaxID=59841 RepID=UPI000FDB74B7|nr:glyoxalase superfamily protein [Paenibacillus kobensis]
MAQFEIAGTTPILRMYDEEATKQFYTEFLEFRMDWEHRYEPDLPLYMQVSSGGCILHLSGHFGDGTPGTAVRIGVRNTEAFHDMLAAKRYKHARPGYNREERSVTLHDPSGNLLRFYEEIES